MSRVSLSLWAVLALTALRVGLGLHFYLEGSSKLRDPKPFSAPFFSQAKGPFAWFFHSQIWDADGFARLNKATVFAYWDSYRQQVVNHYGFDKKQTDQAKAAFEDFKKRYEYHLGSYKEEFDEYLLQVERRNKNSGDQVRQGLESLTAHDARITGDRMQLWAKLVPPIDQMFKDYEARLNNIASLEVRQSRGRLEIGKVGRFPFDSEFMDWFMRYFDFTVGLLLILGLLTRPAALAAAGFLGTVCLAQFPGSYGAVPIYYQMVEMLALFALAAVGGKRLIGLDYVVTGLWSLCCKKPAAAAAQGAAATTTPAQKSAAKPSSGAKR